MKTYSFEQRRLRVLHAAHDRMHDAIHGVKHLGADENNTTHVNEKSSS